MRKALIGVACALLGLSLASCHKATDDIGERFIVNLAGANEVPARSTGAAGMNGPIRIALFPGPGANFTTNPLSGVDGQLYEGSFEASDVTGISYADLLAGMRAGTVYGNVHTTNFPGGEIRGQAQLLP